MDRVFGLVSSEINAKTPHEHNLHRKNEILVFNFKAKILRINVNNLPNLKIWSLHPFCSHSLEKPSRIRWIITGRSLVRISLIATSRPISNYSVNVCGSVCMTLLECFFKFDLIYWMFFLEMVEMSVNLKSRFNQLGCNVFSSFSLKTNLRIFFGLFV